ncbi:RabGAP/TBC [Periconia macrospinosa]|uniref:RabGAP/TBC n=1 Tax=Periconia macrospinosa TaxID=97972 RepID=A0A2V1DS10_9PLEO|nr:RabGAP/TBC [Periconia macrospinosa]
MSDDAARAHDAGGPVAEQVHAAIANGGRPGEQQPPATAPAANTDTDNDTHSLTTTESNNGASKGLLAASSPRGWLSSVRRPKTAPGPRASALKRTLLTEDDARRDSALASSNSTASTDLVTHLAPNTPDCLRQTPSLPAIVVQNDPSPRPSKDTPRPSQHRSPSSPPAIPSQPDSQDAFTLDTIIPTGGFDDLTSPSQVSFSKRGSMLLGGKRANRMNKQAGAPAEEIHTLTTVQSHNETIEKDANEANEAKDGKTATQSPKENKSTPLAPPSTLRPVSRYSARGRVISSRVLSTDEMMLSRKVRAMYLHGNESAAGWDTVEEETESVNKSVADDNDSSMVETAAGGSSLAVDKTRDEACSIMSSRRGSQPLIVKEPNEIAGGIEDWTELEGGEVDRYGFILPKKVNSQGSQNGADGPDEPRMHRVTTALQLVSEEPRKRGIGRSVSRARSAVTLKSNKGSHQRRLSQKSSKPAASIFSNRTARSTPQKIRAATNKLPHNRNRRLLDEASDMLKLPPGLAEVEEQKDGGRTARILKAKEIEREEKWRKMAKVVQSGASNGTMMFEFDVKDHKVVSRTWKGIPDRWRATAWYAFLAASAKNDKDSPSDEELVASFYELQEESSADDMQIDVDVPRTINRHIMFRRRYRGGQRLLFRVLHAMSLYLPDTGYVQGMAALAATLLCYYEEDRAFVMLVRLWMLRGLERLYESGFAGLMDALDDFEKNWLRNGDVAKKLEELCITSTAYGTRWYLTLFNYSLPFPAQLRVWDIFMLLGDASYLNDPSSKFSGDLDVLHATSAALIDATREILMDSDFENAMKVLTSWVPIKDEDMLMRVAKTEYKLRKKRATVK